MVNLIVHVKTSNYRILGNFCGAKFSRNKFLRNKFSRMANEAHVASSCGWNFTKFNFAREQNRVIRENIVPRKFPSIR